MKSEDMEMMMGGGENEKGVYPVMARPASGALPLVIQDRYKSIDSSHNLTKSQLYRALWPLLLIALGVRGGELNLCWDPSSSTDAVGYAIYYGNGIYNGKRPPSSRLR